MIRSIKNIGKKFGTTSFWKSANEGISSFPFHSLEDSLKLVGSIDYEMPEIHPLALSQTELEDLINIQPETTVLKQKEELEFLSQDIVIKEYEQKTKSPSLLYLPFSGSESFSASLISKFFFAHGFNVFHIKKPKPINKRHKKIGPMLEYGTALQRYSQIIDYLSTKHNVDEKNISSLGISLGAIIDSSLCISEPRINSHIIIMGGAPFKEVIQNSKERGLKKRLRQIKKIPNEKELLFSNLNNNNYDPANYDGIINPDNILQIISGNRNSRKDIRVPTYTQYCLREFLERPSTIVSPYGHEMTLRLAPFLFGQSVNFMKSRLR